MARLLLVALALTWAQGLAAQDSPVPERVARLVARLGDPDLAVRESAMADLVAMGEAARPLLRRHAEHPDAEIRLRVAGVLRLLPEDLVEGEGLPAANLVDLKMPRGSLGDAVERLERRGGLRFVRPLAVDPETPVDLVLEKAPLLEVLDALAEAAGTRWLRDMASGDIRFVQGHGARPIRRYRGPLRLAFTGAGRSANLQFGLERRESFYLQGQVDVEPGAALLGAWIPPKVLRARDDRGKDLLPEASSPPRFQPLADSGAAHFTVQLAPPSAEARRIAAVGLSLDVVVATAWRQLELELRPGEEAVSGPARARVLGLETVEGRRRLRIEISGFAVAHEGAGGRSLRDEQLEIADELGSIWPLASPIARAAAPAGRELLTYDLPAEARGTTLRVRFLARCERVELDFEFEDLDLP